MIRNEADPDFTKWAIETMFCWKNINSIDYLISIHGEKDKIFLQ